MITEEPMIQRPEPITVSIMEIQNLMDHGYTRYITSPGYNPAIGSIEQYYGLSKPETALLFQDSRLSRIRTKNKRVIFIKEDIEVTENVNETPIAEITSEELPQTNGEFESSLQIETQTLTSTVSDDLTTIGNAIMPVEAIVQQQHIAPVLAEIEESEEIDNNPF